MRSTRTNLTKSINQTTNRTIDRSIDQSIEQSINQSIDRSVNPSINPKGNQSIDRSIDRYDVLSYFSGGYVTCYSCGLFYFFSLDSWSLCRPRWISAEWKSISRHLGVNPWGPRSSPSVAAIDPVCKSLSWTIYCPIGKGYGKKVTTEKVFRLS